MLPRLPLLPAASHLESSVKGDLFTAGSEVELLKTVSVPLSQIHNEGREPLVSRTRKGH